MREHDHINQHSNRNENQMHHRESSRSKEVLITVNLMIIVHIIISQILA